MYSEIIKMLPKTIEAKAVIVGMHICVNSCICSAHVQNNSRSSVIFRAK